MQLKLQWDPLSNKFLCISDILTGLLCSFLVQFLFVAGPWFLGIKNFTCWSWSWHMDLSFTELGLVNRRELFSCIFHYSSSNIYTYPVSLLLFSSFYLPFPYICVHPRCLFWEGAGEERRMEENGFFIWTWWL